MMMRKTTNHLVPRLRIQFFNLLRYRKRGDLYGSLIQNRTPKQLAKKLRDDLHWYFSKDYTLDNSIASDEYFVGVKIKHIA